MQASKCAPANNNSIVPVEMSPTACKASLSSTGVFFGPSHIAISSQRSPHKHEDLGVTGVTSCSSSCLAGPTVSSGHSVTQSIKPCVPIPIPVPVPTPSLAKQSPPAQKTGTAAITNRCSSAAPPAIAVLPSSQPIAAMCGLQPASSLEVPPAPDRKLEEGLVHGFGSSSASSQLRGVGHAHDRMGVPMAVGKAALKLSFLKSNSVGYSYTNPGTPMGQSVFFKPGLIL